MGRSVNFSSRGERVGFGGFSSLGGWKGGFFLAGSGVLILGGLGIVVQTYV